MLACKILSSPDLKNDLLQALAPQDALWVVSDLEAKFWYQKQLRIFNEGFLAGDPVLRASELWAQLLQKNDPQWQALPGQLSHYLVEKWMSEIIVANDSRLSQKDRAKAYATIGQILPLLSHFQGEEALEEWFSEKDQARERWFAWYQMGKDLWQRFLEKKRVPQEWMKAVLLNQELPVLNQKTIVFDLNLDIDDVESELILNLSRDHDVYVLVPSFEQDKEWYRNLLDRCLPELLQVESEPANLKFKKLPSMLSEIKQAVAQCRSWLDDGIELEDIAIASSEIENYWPTLSEYLRVEGIPVAKNTVTPLSQLPTVQIWLARMRIALDSFKRADGEISCFTGEDNPPLDYEQYRSSYSNAYEVSDFHRNQQLKSHIPEERNPLVETDLASFLEWATTLLPEAGWNLLDEIFQDFDEILLQDEKLSFLQWLDLFENYFCRTETKVLSSGAGLLVTSLSGALNPKINKLILLGLTEANLSEVQQTALSWTDIESIKMNFGFNLPHADRQVGLDRVSWLLSKGINEVYCYYAEADFMGKFQAPSVFWLREAMNVGASVELSSPQKTRWDEIMLSDQNHSLGLLDATLQRLEQGIARDLGEASYPSVELKDISLSASSLEEYFKCPFKFYAQKVLGLSQLPSLDLDIDYMTRGRLIHRICELVISEKKWGASSAEVDTLIEKARKDIEMPIYNDEIWQFLKPVYQKLTHSFMEFEGQWRTTYPQTQTFGVEKFIKTSIGVEEGELKFGPEMTYPFRGMIDRIDYDGEGRYVILDYKSSDAGLTQFGSWLKKGKIQMAIYSLALMEGALDGNPMDISGCYYYVLKSMERKKGLHASELSEDFLPKSKKTREDWLGLLGEMKTLIVKLIEDIEIGRIEAAPEDEKHCDNCDWKQICRNPNLNQ